MVVHVRIGPFVMMVLAASALSTPQSAGAATTCQSFEGDIIVQTDETASAPVTLRVADDVLFVNGVSCGQSSTNVVTVIDVGEPSADRVVIDLAEPFVMGGDVVFVNLVLGPDAAGVPDQVTVLGSNSVDNVTLGATVLTNSGNTIFAGGDSLQLVAQFSPGVSLDIRLRDGADTFAMPADSNGEVFVGDLSIRGGRGADVLRGGRGPQEIRGGAGPDVISGGPGRDRLWGNSGRDTIRGNRGRDSIWGGKGRDTVNGGRHGDVLYMQDGRVDVVDGGRGKADSCVCDDNDTLRRAGRATAG